MVVLDDLCRSVFPDRAAETDAAFAAAGVRHLQSTDLRAADPPGGGPA